jgi:pyruvate kinase
MEALHADALASERALVADIERIPERWRPSARNLAHYLALRNHDLRALQQRLAMLGLSSLGRAEANTLASIEAVLAALARIEQRAPGVALQVPIDSESGAALLEAHTEALLGPPPAARATHVMVTMPSEAADDPELVRDLVEAGMDCARINGAHDGPAVWERISANVRAAAQALGRSCRVLFDLPGPKLRTAPFPEGPRALHLKPERGPRGEVLRPARVLLGPEGAPASPHAPRHGVRLPLVGDLLDGAEPGDRLRLRDLRGRRRALEIVETGARGALACLYEGAWVETGTRVELVRGGEPRGAARVGTLPPAELRLVVRRGETLLLVPEDVPARAASLLGPARVGCTLREVFRDARVGEPIHFDDGKLSGVIRAVVRAGSDAPRLEIEMTACAEDGSRLRGDRGINLPDTRLALPALTARDEEALQHAAAHADMVGLSFLHEPADVLEIMRRLEALGRPEVGIVLKIETARAFQNLPRLMLTAMRSPPLGVMVARGDLAVELGFERLAEVQEEILWLCEAAHVPVIWATQVLESLAKRGRPSRAEVTDAAHGVRSECVMLNKGPYVLEAVRFLDDVLRRMHAHERKKFSMLRRLSVCGLGEAPVPALAP